MKMKMKMIIALLVSVTLLFSGCVGAYNKTESKSASTSIHSKPNSHKKKYLWGIPVISVLAIGSAFLAKSCGKNNTNGKSNASVDNKPLDMAPIGEISIVRAQDIMENYLNTNLDTKGKGGKALATLDADGGEVLIIGDIHADIDIMGKLMPMIEEHLEKSPKNTYCGTGRHGKFKMHRK